MSTTSPPNILFLFPDQWRGDWLPGIPSPYGTPSLQCPNLERLRERGTTFTQCRSNSPLCVPSRACLAQGMRYHHNGSVWSNHEVLDPLRPNFLHALRRQGYQVMSTGKHDLHGHTDFYTNSGWSAQSGKLGFTDCVNQRGKLNAARRSDHRPCPYVAHLRQHELLEFHRQDYEKRENHGAQKAPWPTPLPRRFFTDDFCGRMALDLLEEAPHDGPWFLWVNFPGPHDPHDAPRELQARFDGVNMPGVHRGEDGVQHQQLRRNYAASMSGIDDWIGWLLQAVERRGELDHTLVVFASDHGEMMGDHRRWHKAIWREPSVHVPFIAAGPGLEAGSTRHHLVELIDLAALFSDAAGAEPVPGWDAVHPLASTPRDHQHSALHDGPRCHWEMIFDGRWKYVRDKQDGAEKTEMLFDLQNDPREDQDCLAGHRAQADRLAGLTAESSCFADNNFTQ